MEWFIIRIFTICKAFDSMCISLYLHAPPYSWHSGIVNTCWLWLSFPINRYSNCSLVFWYNPYNMLLCPSTCTCICVVSCYTSICSCVTKMYRPSFIHSNLHVLKVIEKVESHGKYSNLTNWTLIQYNTVYMGIWQIYCCVFCMPHYKFIFLD